MLGNIVTGLAVVGPAGMLAPLADGLDVGIHDVGLLVTYGAAVICVASPIVAWLTTNIDRRTLLVGTLAVIALGQGLSAFAPNYASILILRLGLLAIAAIYTPQAATTIGLIVPLKERPSAITFVLLGWPLTMCVGMPIITFLTAEFGWRITYGFLSGTAGLVALLAFIALPRGLQGRPLSLLSFAEIARNKRILLILLFGLLQTSGQFTVLVYIAPLLTTFTGAGPAVVGSFFAMYGVVGIVGNTAASIVVMRLGPERTQAIFLASTLSGMTLWATGAGWLPAMTAGVFFWALGVAAINGMQQSRLVAAAPDLASASTAINTSVVYTGQAIGSGIGGLLFAHGLLYANGYVAVAFMCCSATLLAVTWPRKTEGAA